MSQAEDHNQKPVQSMQQNKCRIQNQKSKNNKQSRVQKLQVTIEQKT